MKKSCGSKTKPKATEKMPMKGKMPPMQPPMQMTVVDSKIKKIK